MKIVYWSGILFLLSGCLSLPNQSSPTLTASSTASPQPPTVTSTLPPPTPSPQPTLNQSFPNPQSLVWRQVIGAEQLELPTDITHAKDASGRLFVIEKKGFIRLIDSAGRLQAEPFLNIRERVGASASEQGLLGLAFHPQYAQNGFFYVHYTDTSGNTVVSRFQVSSDANLADPASEFILLTQKQPFPNHNGGGLAFGPDGYLYIGLGDGGAAGDPLGAGQDLNTRLGKILRIDVDSASPYAIPADNPFVNGGGLPEIWAYGLRNPWRFSFDSFTGDLYIGDVGQNNWEEINFVSAGSPNGLNFGWNLMEASHPYAGDYTESLINPIAEYSHDLGCSVTGGYVYRGQAIHEMQGIYLFGDYCSGSIWGLLNTPSGWQSSLLFESGYRISTFGVDESGEVYVAGYDGAIYKLEKAP